MGQTILYATMAFILAVGVFASVAGSIITTGGGATPVPVIGGNPTQTTLASQGQQYATQADAALAAGNYSDAIRLYNLAREYGLDTDSHVLLNEAKAYLQKTPPEPLTAQQFLGQLLSSCGNQRHRRLDRGLNSQGLVSCGPSPMGSVEVPIEMSLT